MSQNKMISFHGKQEIKDKYLQRIRIHQQQDEIIQGRTGEGGKGCAVWCTLDNYSHESYETELGIPRIIAKLEDRIFEGLSVADSKTFPLEFLEAVPVGKDLTPVWKQFLVWLLVDETEGVIQYAKTDDLKEIIRQIADLIKRSISEEISGLADNLLQLRKRAYAAYAAYDAAAYAAAAAAYAAYAAAAAYAYAAAAAAYAYAYAAYDAAAYDAAAYAAAAAAYAADAAAYAYAAAAYKNARIKKFSAMRAKLVELLKVA